MGIKKKKRRQLKRITIGMAVVCLVFNLLPGLGTFLSGKYKIGLIQLGIFVLSVIFIATKVGIFIGMPLVIIDFIWAFIGSIQTLQKAL